MAITRRTVLKYGLGGAAILAAGGVGLSLRPSVLRAPQRPLAVFSPLEYSVLAALADRIAPARDGFPPAAQLQVAEKLDDLMAISHPGVADDLRKVLRLMENAVAGFVFDLRTDTFTGSPPEVQDEVLRAWQHSRIAVRRSAYKGLLGLVTATYFSCPEVYPLVGYYGPPSYGNVRRPPPPPPGVPT